MALLIFLDSKRFLFWKVVYQIFGVSSGIFNVLFSKSLFSHSFLSILLLKDLLL